MKEYKNNEELIDNLVTKGVKVKNRNDAKKIVDRYSFYNIINGYRDVFRDLNGVYYKNVYFEEIYAMFLFDKNMRAVLIRYLLDIEITLKSSISEILSSNYGIKDYLKRENFDSNVEVSFINTLIEKINKELLKQINKHQAFYHYHKEYGFIPPYVLMKGLTFGEISKLYDILKQKDRQSISKKFKISDKTLKQILINLTLVRNICAHSERLYNFSSKNKITFKNKDIKIDDSNVNLYVIVFSMGLLLSKENKRKFIIELGRCISEARKNIKSIDINEVLRKMGFVI